MGFRPLTVAAALVAFGATASPVAAQVPDHLKCYKIRDSLKLAGTADLGTPQFGVDPGCTISKAKFFCVPTTKTNVAATDKTTGNPITPLPITGPDPGDRICYKVKCQAPVADQQVTDQFGTRTLVKFKAALLCTPAVKGGPPTTSSTTTTTTTTEPPTSSTTTSTAPPTPSTTTTTLFLPCNAVGDPCGSCGNGICRQLCSHGCVLGCIADVAVGECRTDADCPANSLCVPVPGIQCPGGCNQVLPGPCGPICP